MPATMINELIVNCRISTPHRVIEEFSINHHDARDRRYLGERCRQAFEAGHKVETWPDGRGFHDGSMA